MEQLTLTVPVPAQTIVGYKILSLLLDWSRQRIAVEVQDTLAQKTVTYEYAGALATQLMIGLNTANLSGRSLHKRVLERLVADGRLPSGAVTGLPD